jgi:general secretion pathway protein D
MRWGCLITLVSGTLLSAAWAADLPKTDQQQTSQPQSIALALCPEGAPGGPVCQPSKEDLKQAESAFKKAVKLQKDKHPDEAFDEFETAARLAPRNLDYVTALEMAREQLVYDHLERGNNDLLAKKQIEALAEFRNALQLDPTNKFAQQRIHDAIGEWAPKTSDRAMVVSGGGEIKINPKPARHDFHFRGDGHLLLTQIPQAYGVTVTLDNSVPSRRVWFDIDPVDFFTAMEAAGAVTKTFWAPLTDKQILVAADTPENHRLYDRMVMQTFYLPGLSSPQDLTDISNLLRRLFDMKFVVPQPQNSTIEVRAPQRMVDAATQILEGLGDSRPEVMLDIKLYEISHSLTRNMGLHIPNNFQLFNIPAAALLALGGQNIQDLINQLISSGGINQTNSTALSALLAQLQGQQSSVFSQPLTTFGNGLTLMGLSLDTLSAQLSLNESWVKTIQHATLRAADGADATFRVGTKLPILNASFAPIFNTPAISQVIQNNSFQTPFPSFSYEDIGLNVKAKPTIHANNDVSLALEVQFRSLVGQSVNGIPVIANREYTGSITLLNGEPAVVAGEVTRNEQRSLSGIPGMGAVPGLNKIMASNSKEEDDDELLLVITPNVVSQADHSQNRAVWLQQ